MAVRELPARPNLEQYKKQAKDLLKRFRAGDLDARHRIQQHHPQDCKAPDRAAGATTLALADAQLVIAREHGFQSWPKFTDRIQTLRVTTPVDAIWRSAERAIIAGDAPALEKLLRDHQALFRDEQPPAYVPRGPRPDYSDLDARTIIAREHDVASWREFETLLFERRRPDSPVALFEATVDAIVAGDLNAVATLTREHPNLVRARSTRRHHSTLLHYIGANGVEGFRQKTPKSAVDIAALLLDAGADVD